MTLLRVINSPPVPAGVEPEPTNLTTILHLSDLHFLSTTKVTGGKREDFLRFLDGCLRRCLDQGERFDLVVVTGDLADNNESGQPERRRALESAQTYLKDVCTTVGLDHADRLLVIPGNHDYRWKGNLYGKTLQTDYRDFFNDYEHHLLWPERQVLIACFDSNATSYLFELAKGRVDITQFEEMEQEIDKLPPALKAAAKSAMRIALVHHHPLPIAKSETLEPKSWLDWILGRRVVGAPEYMMLRNSGTFLHRLFQHGFRLVLHGHLHRRGYWLPVTFMDNKEQWLEVIASGSAGQPADGEAHTFNIIKIRNPPGLVEASHVDFEAEGNIRSVKPVSTSTAGYDFVRARVWENQLAGSDKSVQCDTYTKRWDVILPEGDLLTTEVIKGLRTNGKKVPAITLYSASKGMSHTTFDARCQNGNRSVSPEKTTRPGIGKTPPRVDFQLKFDPPLDENPVDIVCQRRVLGGLFSSREDQIRSRDSKDPEEKWGRDELIQNIRLQCDRFLLTLRILTPPEWMPDGISLRVEDSSRRPDELELRSGSVMWDSWEPRDPGRHTELPYNDMPLIPEAFLTILRPRLGHRYILSWDLVDREPLSDGGAIAHLRARLDKLDREEALGSRLQAALATILQSFRDQLQVMNRHCFWNDPSMRLCLFAFHDENSSLVPRLLENSPAGDSLPRAYNWGKDIIGTAFRRRKTIGLSRPAMTDLNDESGTHLLTNLDASIQHLLAFPIYGPISTDARFPSSINWPVAVLAIASNDRNSGLQVLSGNLTKVMEASQTIERIWNDFLPEPSSVTSPKTPQS